MPVIPHPYEHLQSALDAIDEHLAHHGARIDFHKAEIEALHQLRSAYLDVRNGLTVSRPGAAVTVLDPTRLGAVSFDEVVSTMSGRIPQA